MHAGTCRTAHMLGDEAVRDQRSLRDMDAFATLRKDITWTVEWFRLVDSLRPIALFSPSDVNVIPLSKRDAVQFWPLPSRPRKKRGHGDDGALCDDDDGMDEVEPEHVAPDEDGADLPNGGDELGDPIADATAKLFDLMGDVGGAKEGDVDDDADGSDSSVQSLESADEGVEDILGDGLDELKGELEELLQAPEPMPPPAPPPPPSVAESSVRSRAPVCSVDYMGGVISFYKDGRFQATCPLKTHPLCRLTRYANAAGADKGRPIGLMAAWIASANDWNQDEHRKKETLYFLTQPARLKHRLRIKESPGGPQLISHEKPLASPLASEEPDVSI
jgi:hypothetical protein